MSVYMAYASSQLNVNGSRDGKVVRALASHQCGPGLIPGLSVICGLSLLLVLVPAPRGFFSGYFRFSSLHKNQHSKFQFDLERVVEWPLCGCGTEIPIYLFIILFIYYFIYSLFYLCTDNTRVTNFPYYYALGPVSPLYELGAGHRILKI